MFTEIKKKVSARFNDLRSLGTVFTTDYDRDDIWECYLNGFDEDVRQEHNCNCCKSFIRQAGGMVAINPDLTLSTLWGIDDVPEKYKKSIAALDAYVKSRTIDGLFFHGESSVGTDESVDLKRDVVWQHFYLKVPANLVDKRGTFLSKSSLLRDQKNSLKRALKEISEDSVETVLEIITQGALYRGATYKHILEKFSETQGRYKQVSESVSDQFCWLLASSLPEAVSTIRNTAIGTLLLDLSEGKDLEKAVASFERIVAPSNYKRPTALVTPKMIEAAKSRLIDLGLISALERRKLDSRDLPVSNALYVHRPKPNVKDVFKELVEESPVPENVLKKVDEVHIKDFIENVLPTAESVKVLFERGHMGNLMTLTGPVDPEASNLFNWGNSFGWSYTGGVADSIKEKVKRAGGNVQGWFRASLAWYNFDDLDLHFKGPRDHIYYANKRSADKNIHLDVDMNAGRGTTREPVENIYVKNQLPKGNYSVLINNFSSRDRSDKGYEVEIEYDGMVKTFSSVKSPKMDGTHTVLKFLVDSSGKITLEENSGFSSSTRGITKWGVTTGLWHKVKAITLSPNHWGEPQGNKHWFFLLEGCVSDEKTRPFYNEFLRSDLAKERKVTEILGDKVQVLDAEGAELSGLGFSETIRNHVYVEVEGKFKRIIKVNF